MCISLSLALSPEFPVCALDPSLFLKRVAFVLSNVFNDVLLSKLTRQAMLHHVLVILDPLGSCLPLGLLSVVAPSNPGAARGRSLLTKGQMATIMVVFRQVPWFLLASPSLPWLPLIFPCLSWLFGL